MDKLWADIGMNEKVSIGIITRSARARSSGGGNPLGTGKIFGNGSPILGST